MMGTDVVGTSCLSAWRDIHHRNVATGSANNLKWPPLDQEVETEDSKPYV
jgi:hypothetical protein